MKGTPEVDLVDREMVIMTRDQYLERLVKFVEEQARPLIGGVVVLKLNPARMHYVQSRLEALHELESVLAGTPINYLRAYVSDLDDHHALKQLHKILRLLDSLKVVSVLPPLVQDPTRLSFLPFDHLKLLELRGCDLSTFTAKGISSSSILLRRSFVTIPPSVSNSAVRVGAGVARGGNREKELILATVEEREMVDRFGMVLTKSP